MFYVNPLQMSDILWTWAWARNSIILYFTLEQEISSLNPVTLVRPLGRGQRQNLRCPSHRQHLTLPRSWQLQQQQGLVTVTPLSLLLEPTTTEVVRPGVKLRGIDRLPPGEPDNQVQPDKNLVSCHSIPPWCTGDTTGVPELWSLLPAESYRFVGDQVEQTGNLHLQLRFTRKTDGLTTLHKQLFQHCQVGKNRNALMSRECIWGGIRWVTTCSGGWLLGWLPAPPLPDSLPPFSALPAHSG